MVISATLRRHAGQYLVTHSCYLVPYPECTIVIRIIAIDGRDGERVELARRNPS